MKKDEIFDLVVKGFGVYLLVLAIISIPRGIEGLFLLWLYTGCSTSEPAISSFIASLHSSSISQSVVAIIKFIIYIIASVNFLRSGSLVKKLMGVKTPAEPVAQADRKG
jgi:hypothetical protein